MERVGEQYQRDIAAVAKAREIGRLLDRWYETRNCDDLPELAQFDTAALQDFADNLMIVRKTDNGMFQIAQAAAHVEGLVKRRLGGCYISDIGPNVGPYLTSVLEQALHSEEPIYSMHRSEFVVTIQTWELLALPVRRAAKDIDLFVYAYPLQFHHEFLEAVLDANPDGVVSIRAVRDEDGSIIDAIILSANPAAARLLAIPRETLLGGRLSKLVPDLVESRRWDTYRTVIETGQSAYYEVKRVVSGAGRTFRAGLTRLGDGLTVSFYDISDLIKAKRDLEERQAELIEANQNLEEQALELAALATNLENTHQSLNAEIARRQELEHELRRQAETDPLTGVANRRHFLERATAETRRSRRYGHALSVIMLDIDHFKTINDTYGHSLGDQAIMSVCEVCRCGGRDGVDVVGRMGGEEFAILLPETNRSAAAAVAERLRRQIADTRIGDDREGFFVTASFGVAQMEDEEYDINPALRRADTALYAAKNSGRDRVEVDGHFETADCAPASPLPAEDTRD